MDVFSKIKKEAKKHFLTAKGSHDWQHNKRVHSLCMYIGKKENADLEILKFAAILHDIGRSHQDTSNGKISHAEQGSIMARKLLEKHHFDHDKTDKIIHCIESHSFRGRKQPQSKEAEILFDADKLDSIGAVGIGRAFLFAGEIGAKLHNDEVDINITKPYTRQDTAYREFMFKLIKVKDRMLTREGKRIAEERHKFMVDFFDRLKEEVEGKS